MNTDSPEIWKSPLYFWGTLLAAVGLAIFIFRDGLELMVQWWERDEYSHGYMIPLVVLFLVWQKKNELERAEFRGSWAGVGVVLLGLSTFILGEMSSIYTIIQYGFLITLYGILLGMMGWRSFSIIWVPLLILVFMIPLPTFLYNNLSSQLQLISSQIGVAVIRAFDISVYLEGNVIDLGTYKLQVVEACSGLRYLFPLMALGFIAAYFFKAEFWKRALIFLSSIPITILMNSFRIGVIGVTVEYWGQEMAEGFLHDFEGWIVFMACTVILILEMWLLSMVGREKKELREVFGIEFPDETPENGVFRARKVPLQQYLALAMLASMILFSFQLEQREEIRPDRAEFAGFPSTFDGWSGKTDRLDSIYIDTLKFDDYLLADYTDNRGNTINLYVAYYGSQSKGQSIHSPRSCIPGGGWQIKSLDQVGIDGVHMQDTQLRVNRVVIQMGDVKQLVYYWFQGRSRIITNEYMAKWYLFWDSLTRNRTDGALVRLTTVIYPGEEIGDADQLLASFSGKISGALDTYIPK